MAMIAVLLGGLAFAKNGGMGGSGTTKRIEQETRDGRPIRDTAIPGVIESNKRRLRGTLDTDPVANTAYDDYQYSKAKRPKPPKAYPVAPHPDYALFGMDPEKIDPNYYAKYEHFKRLSFRTPSCDLMDIQHTGHYNPEPVTMVRSVPISVNYRGTGMPKRSSNPKEFSNFPQHA